MYLITPVKYCFAVISDINTDNYAIIALNLSYLPRRLGF